MRRLISEDFWVKVDFFTSYHSWCEGRSQVTKGDIIPLVFSMTIIPAVVVAIAALVMFSLDAFLSSVLDRSASRIATTVFTVAIMTGFWWMVKRLMPKGQQGKINR